MKLLTTLLLTFFGLTTLIAQDFTVDTTTPDGVTVCGTPVTFLVKVTRLTNDPVESITLAPNMPSGMIYITGSAVGMTEQLPGKPVFVIENFTGEKTFSFQAKANCELISFLRDVGSIDNLINNETVLSYQKNGLPMSVQEINGSESYSVLYADLELFVPENEKNIPADFITVVKNRHIKISNNGFGNLDTIVFYIKADPELQVQKLELELSSGNQLLSGTTTAQGIRYLITDFTSIGNGNNLFEQGEVLTLVDYVRVLKEKTSIETLYTAQWGCQSGVCNLNDVEATFFAYIEAIGGKAAIRQSMEVPVKMDFCSNAEGELLFKFTNEGFGNIPAFRDAAFDVMAKVQQSYYGYENMMNDHHCYLKTVDGLLVNIDHLLVYTESSSSHPSGSTYYSRFYDFPLSDAFSSDPDGAGGLSDLDADGFYDDLPSGSQLKVVFKPRVTFTGEVKAGASKGYSGNQLYFYGNLRYKIWSGQTEYYSLNPNYSGGVYVDVRGRHLSGPSDLVNGRPETIRLNLKATTSNSIANFDKGYLEFKVNLPKGVTLKSVKWSNTNLAFTQTGTTAVAKGNFYRYPSVYDIDFQVELNCSQASGILVEKFNVDSYFYPDVACQNQRYFLGTSSKSLYIHCQSCSSVETTEFVAERITLGWVPLTYPRTHYTYGDLFGAAPVAKITNSTPGTRLDAAYARDEVMVTTKGRITGSFSYNTLYADVAYTSGFALEALSYQSASFVVGTKEYSLPADFQPQTSNADSTYQYKFTIPLGTNGIPASLSPGTTYELKLRFKANDFPATLPNGEYGLSEFRGTFYTVKDGLQTSCLGFGDDFTMLKSSVYNTEMQSAYYNLTNEGKVCLASISVQNAKGHVSFPDFQFEFRSLAYPNTIQATLPKGFVFDTSKPLEWNVDGSKVLTQDVTYSNNNQSVTVNLNKNTPMLHRSYIMLYATVKIECNDPANVFVPAPAGSRYDLRNHTGKFSLSSFAYLPNTSNHVTPGLSNVNYQMLNSRSPNLRLTSNSEQEGYSDKVVWPIQLCNPFSSWHSNAKNTWIAVELLDSDESTIFQGATDIENNQLSVVYYGRKDANHPAGRNMMVKVGDLSLSSCIQVNLIASYKNCQPEKSQKIYLYASGDLVDYPNVTNYSGSITNRKPSCETLIRKDSLSLKYKVADFQWDVVKLGRDEVDLCVNVPFYIDLASTKYADMKDVKVWVKLPHNATFNPDLLPHFQYPYHESPERIPDAAYIRDGDLIGFDVTQLVGGNLPGIRLPNNKIKLVFNMLTSCGYDPGVPIHYKVTAFTNCGDYIEFDDQRKIRIQGVSSSLDTIDLKLIAPENLTCSSDNEITVSIKNSGDLASTLNQLELILPAGTEFRSIIGSDLPPPLVSSQDNNTHLRWTLEDGYLLSQQEKTFKVLTYLGQTPNGQSSVRFAIRTYKTADGRCNESDLNCSTEATSAAHELTVPVTGLASLDIRHEKMICAYKFSSTVGVTDNCSTNGYFWNFGDGTTSADREPVHAFGYSGVFNVSLNVSFNCNGCSGSQTKQIQLEVLPADASLKDTLIQVISEIKKQVLRVSASTFSDAWPTQHVSDDVEQMHGFANGTEGVWRNEGAYVYQTERKASETPDVETDGTFDLNAFNWEQADLDAITGWTKANTMTQYSPYSYELENQDVLGIYSAALYDYGGHLPSANGVNMRNSEMAFTSFEFFDPGTSNAFGKQTSGNWIFGTERMPAYNLYEVHIGSKNTAVIKATMKELEDATQADVVARSFGTAFFLTRFRTVRNNQIVCTQPYPENPRWTIVVFEEAPFPGLWKGKIKIKNQVDPVVTPDIDGTIAHSGLKSLMIKTQKSFEQKLLRLDSGKRYFICAWVSVNNPSVATPKVANNVGIEVITKSKSGYELAKEFYTPVGPVIEGWQQIRGTFTYSGNREAVLDLKFYPAEGGKTAWYDDLRLHPENGNMKSYVYDIRDYRLNAILDEENFASYYFYDAEGNLYLTKKETEGGVKTISENLSNLIEK